MFRLLLRRFRAASIARRPRTPQTRTMRPSSRASVLASPAVAARPVATRRLALSLSSRRSVSNIAAAHHHLSCTWRGANVPRHVITWEHNLICCGVTNLLYLQIINLCFWFLLTSISFAFCADNNSAIYTSLNNSISITSGIQAGNKNHIDSFQGNQKTYFSILQIGPNSYARVHQIGHHNTAYIHQISVSPERPIGSDF